VVAITTDPDAGMAGILERVGEPSLTSVDVFTMAMPRRTSILAVDARSEASFLAGWGALTGARESNRSRRLAGMAR
jgi:hypothetical protein